MPKSQLFGISVDGCAYSLQSDSSAWSEFAYVGLEFKTLSGIPNFLWAIGGDRQVYVYVYGLDIPIKVKEVAYENQVSVLIALDRLSFGFGKMKQVQFMSYIG